MSSTALVWLRRDLRLSDQPALSHACQHHHSVIPVFIWDPESEGRWPMGAASRWWLHHSLQALSAALAARGSRLVVRAGATVTTLQTLAAESGASAVYWNRCYEPAAIARDTAVKQALRRADLLVESFNAAQLMEPWHNLKGDGSPYVVFTPYWKAMQKQWQCAAPRPAPDALPAPQAWPSGLAVDELELLPDRHWAAGFAEHWQPGEDGAQRRLNEFASSAVADYDDLRNRPDQAGTSRFSPHLHFGELSPAQVVWALDPAGELPTGKGPLSLVRELAWREFAVYLLYHFPHLPEQPLRPAFNDFPWRQPAEYAADLRAWQRGQTGVPMVDAGMRELWHTGWMHNRVRMVVASYLTKHLLIPWQEGARWFWDTLVDANLANNTQGWQWTSGCGADASPYFRIFNPVLQGEKFDPRGDYVRHWCPELSHVVGKAVHQPSESVDLKFGRERALAAYRQITSGR